MTITSIDFLFFCVAAVALFLIFPRRFRWIALLISSICFYVYSANRLIVFILLTSAVIWLAGILMGRVQKQADEALKAPDMEKEQKKAVKKAAAKRRKRILLTALILNVGILVVFKVYKYFVAAVTVVAGLLGGGSIDFIKLVTPLGISYYTFSTVGYLLDVYWKRYAAERNYPRFLLYAIYFPHIVQGPISRYNLLGEELKKPELRFRWDNFVVGMESILLGCFKKLVIADRAAIFVGNTLNEGGLKGVIYLIAIILDAIQIYADFSGYMDIVSGISLLFDVRLEQNFNHPFLSKSVPEFWRRWHMSLGSWFKDYVYYPITVSKLMKKLNKKTMNWKHAHLKSLMVVVIPVMVTWLLTGLWHGTGKGYVAWGIYYGIIITLSVTFSSDVERLVQKLRINTECFSYRLFQTLKIFCIFMGGRFLGSTMGMSHRLEIIKNMFRAFLSFEFYNYGLDGANFLILIAGILLLVAVAVIEQRENIFAWFNRQNKLFCALVIYVLFFAVFLLGIYGAGYDSSSFMYQQY